MKCQLAAYTAFLLILAGCSEPANREPDSTTVDFTVVSEETTDLPVKTQVEQHLVLGPDVTEAELHALLEQQYDEIMSRRGFQYHERPTNVFVYVYETRDRAEAEQGLWLGMLAKGASDAEPRVTIRSEAVAGLGAEAEDRHGLSEDERKAIFRRIVQSEDRAMDDAEEQAGNDIIREARLMSELSERYKDELAAELGLTRDELREIGLEGVTMRWPMP